MISGYPLQHGVENNRHLKTRKIGTLHKTKQKNSPIESAIQNIIKMVLKLIQTRGSSQVNLYEGRAFFAGLLRDFGARYPLSTLKKNSSVIVNGPNF